MTKKGKRKTVPPSLIFIILILCLISIIGLTLFFLPKKNNRKIENLNICESKNISSEGSELDINSDDVKKLYSFAKINVNTSPYKFITTDNYFSKKISNKYILQLGINSMYKNQDFLSRRDSEQSSKNIYYTKTLNQRINDIFGSEIKYTLEDDINGLKLLKNKQEYDGTFLYTEEYETYTHLKKAYKTENKVILFEKGLFFQFIDSDTYRAYDSPYRNIIENFVKRDPVNQTGIYENIYQKHICNLSTYKYTFTLNEKGGYYLSSFEEVK